MNWIDVNSGMTGHIKPPFDETVLCYCPEWNDWGYKVAQWNGREFFYEGQPDNNFNHHVVSWAIIS